MDRQATAASSRMSPVPEVCERSTPRTSTARVILVDDNDIFLSFVSDLMEDLGFNVTPFNSAQVALDAIRLGETGSSDLIVTDYRMPGMCGVTMAKSLRDSGVNQTIVMISSDPLEVIRAAHPDVGRYVGGYFSKDEPLIETVHMIASILSQGDLPGDIE